MAVKLDDNVPQDSNSRQWNEYKTQKVIISDAKYLSTKVLKYVLKYYLGTYLFVLKYLRKLVLSTYT